MMSYFRFATVFLCAFYCSTALGSGWNYKFDPNHTSVDYKISHFGFSNPSGKFAKIEGKIYFDEKKPVKSRVEVIIAIKNLVTGNKKLESELKSVDFFNVENFPVAKFKSTKIKMRGKNSAKIYGELTILGVTKPITLNAKLNKIGISPVTKKKTIGFNAKGVIKRSDFGMNYGTDGISDKVEISIEAEAWKI